MKTEQVFLHTNHPIHELSHVFNFYNMNKIFTQGISRINGVNVHDIYYLHKIDIAQLT